MQHQQAQQMTPQALMAARSSMLQYAQQPFLALQQQQVQALHSQLGMGSCWGIPTGDELIIARQRRSTLTQYFTWFGKTTYIHGRESFYYI